MRFAYSAQACSAHAGSLALTARTLSLGTLFCRRLLFLGGRVEAHGLAAPDLLEVVELAHRRMHDVHHHVAEVDEHPLAGLLSLYAVHPRAELADALLHAIGERLHLAVGVAARDDHALEHGGHAGGVVDDDVAPLHILECLDHGALLRPDVHHE